MTTTGRATVNSLTASSGTIENTMSQPERVKPSGIEDVTLEGDESNFSLEVPPYSLSIYTIEVAMGSSADIQQPAINTQLPTANTPQTYDLQGRRSNPRHPTSSIQVVKGRKYIVR